MQVYDGQTTGMHWQKHKQGADHYRRMAAEGKETRMPIAVTLGCDPVTLYSSILPLPPSIDEMLFAGFMRGAPVELVKCETNEIEVPANAEIVLEGYVNLGELRREGPFGDHTGFYSLDDDYPVFHIECITQRKNPVYPATIVGPPPMEDFYMGKAIERIFLAADADAVAGSARYLHARRRCVSQLDSGFHAQDLSRARAQSDACDLGLRAGDVQQMHRRGGRRCGCAECIGSGLEGAEQYRSAARHRVLHGAGGFARSCEPVAGLRFEDGRGCDAQDGRRRVHAALAGCDQDVARSGEAGGRFVEARGLV